MHGMRDTVTIWNKVIENGKTVYYRRIVSGCYWRAEVIRSVSGSTVSLGTTWRLMIEMQDGYKSHSEWLKMADKSAFFTLNVGDIVAKGEHTEEMTAANATAVYTKLKPDIFTVKTVIDSTNPWKYGQHIAVEGV